MGIGAALILPWAPAALLPIFVTIGCIIGVPVLTTSTILGLISAVKNSQGQAKIKEAQILNYRTGLNYKY